MGVLYINAEMLRIYINPKTLRNVNLVFTNFVRNMTFSELDLGITPHCARPVEHDETDMLSMPLAARMRPTCFEEYVGQSHLLAPGKLLRRAIDSDRFTSIVLWGPAGIGKTSLAELIARQTQCAFIRMSGVVSTVADMREVIAEAIARRRATGQGTLVFIDEIHRWTKSQQDVLLPDVERGTVRLIGATTENPHFYVVGPLLSRSLVFQLESLSEADVSQLLLRGCQVLSEQLQNPVTLSPDALQFIASTCEGDGRKAIGALEVAAMTTPQKTSGEIGIALSDAEASMQKKQLAYGDDGHYDTASAFIKSMRGSDPDAAIYWLAKMIHAGEDPRFIARRIVIFASEDVGNADPRALQVALSAFQACELIGMPESRIILAQAVTYCATAPKSNASYLAVDAALADVASERVHAVPMHLRDAHYKGGREMGHGKDYQYPHDFKGGFVPQEYLAVPKKYYVPKGVGYEERIKERIQYWDTLRKQTHVKGAKS